MINLDQSDQALIKSLVALGKTTSAIILAYYGNKAALNTQHKSNNTPLTNADLAAHNHLARELPRIIDIAYVSEESSPATQQTPHDDYWLVDPIDGTKDFINQTGDFCIAIARIRHTRPILGFIYSPTTDKFWVALKQKGAYSGDANSAHLNLTRIHSTKDERTTRIITSSSSKSALLMKFITETNSNSKRLFTGSALKFCAIAEGLADLYPKLSATTSQWDIAAGELILNEAGGGVMIQGSDIIEYGSVRPMLNPPFIAYGASISSVQLDIYRQFMQDNL